jgi:hypothetical protein
MRPGGRKRMTAEQFRDALTLLGLTPSAFAWLTGSAPPRVARWLSGEEPDIPLWAPLLCALLSLPGAPDMAADIARSAEAGGSSTEPQFAGDEASVVRVRGGSARRSPSLG